MLGWLLAILCLILIIGFPLLTFHFIRKTRKSENETIKAESYSELKASILYLQTAFPTILLLMGILGYGTYELIIDKVTKKVEEKVYTIIEKEKIVSWTKEIEDYRDRAQSNALSIEAIATVAEDTISRIVTDSFLELLPRGTIIPFKGSINDFNIVHWAVCDGTRGTPDLRDRFIFGGNFDQQGDKGGARTHTHKASTLPQGNVTKSGAREFPHKEGTGTVFPVESHRHNFTGIKSDVTVANNEHFPPYYRLVYLMKII